MTDDRPSPRRILIVGHGTAGQSLAQGMRSAGDTVVGFLDDSDGSPDVLGRLEQVEDVLSAYDVDLLCFAIPSADAETVRRFLARVRTNVEIAIVPRTYGVLAKDSVDVDDLTDVDVLDLIGRKPVKHDLLAAREFVRGKSVLVTGAAGSIGSRLVRQLLDLEPHRVTGVDFSESGIFFLGSDLAHNEHWDLRIGDVRDETAMRELVATVRPDIIFHAAAYKHVPLMQAHPLEALLNNVGGSLTMMTAAVDAGVPHFVYVSTDKAVNPVNVMGATKRIGEMLMESIAGESSSTVFNAVRFGNVIQSSGSVMQIFRNQIARRQALTVTDPDVTRFFMTLDEASQLVIQSAFVGAPSDIYVLDMGEPVRIMDLAESLVRTVDPTLTIEITGLRPGEKMFEELSYEPENVSPTANGKIFVVRDALPFDQERFRATVRDLLERARARTITADELIDVFRDMGFAIQ